MTRSTAHISFCRAQGVTFKASQRDFTPWSATLFPVRLRDFRLTDVASTWEMARQEAGVNPQRSNLQRQATWSTSSALPSRSPPYPHQLPCPFGWLLGVLYSGLRVPALAVPVRSLRSFCGSVFRSPSGMPPRLSESVSPPCQPRLPALLCPVFSSPYYFVHSNDHQLTASVALANISVTSHSSIFFFGRNH